VYSDTVQDHFRNPRNTGVIEDSSGAASIGDPECGDYLHLYLKIVDNHVTEARYQIRGCPAAIACASMATELAMGRHIDDVWNVTDQVIIEALDGLPDDKQHCSNLGATALHTALFDYFERKNYPGKAGEI